MYLLTAYINMCMFETVKEFEKQIADYYGAPYAVAVDSCTHAIELSLRYDNPQVKLTIPTRTYISIPFTLMKLNLDWSFVNADWVGFYFIGGTRIIDGAVNFAKESYIRGQLMCLSFQHKKMLSLGRGGAILCPTEQDYQVLKQMAYDGRTDDKPWAEQDIKQIGYHYYMTPETAELGIEKLKTVNPDKLWTSDDYPYLPSMGVFQ
jgi:dTDP-4-amino-4,6-dideoxygalactose transaminase